MSSSGGARSRAYAIHATAVESRATDWQARGANQELFYHGFSISNVGGTIAEIKIRNGTQASDPIIDTLYMNKSDFETRTVNRGVRAKNGIFVDIVSGTMNIIIFYSTND